MFSTVVGFGKNASNDAVLRNPKRDSWWFPFEKHVILSAHMHRTGVTKHVISQLRSSISDKYPEFAFFFLGDKEHSVAPFKLHVKYSKYSPGNRGTRASECRAWRIKLQPTRANYIHRRRCDRVKGVQFNVLRRTAHPLHIQVTATAVNTEVYIADPVIHHYK